MIYLAVAGVVFAVNLLPALGPPTWAVLVLFRLHSDAAPIPLVVIGALAAAGGRFTLATGARLLGDRLGADRRARLDRMRARLLRHRAGALAGLALFVLSPLPSAQLFMAAGLIGVPLVPATAAFFAGRLVSYAGYVTAASLADRSYGEVATDALRSPWGIAVQLALLLLVTLLPFVPWPRGGSAAGAGGDEDEPDRPASEEP